MKYANGQTVRVGDRVLRNEGIGGIVVFNVDDDEYGADYPRGQWDYLKRGVMIRFSDIGLVHFENEIDADVVLVSRGPRSPE